MRRLATCTLLALVLWLPGCARRVGASAAQKPVRLLAETADRETTQLTERREDVEVDTRDYDRTPRVVAKGETPLLPAEGQLVRLYGDEAASKGIEVDNFILLEVLGEDGKVKNRAAVGFTDLVLMGNERVDNLGRRAFKFEAGEVVLGSLLPEKGYYRLRATVLDYYGVGRCSDVWLHFQPAGAGAADDLRGQ